MAKRKYKRLHYEDRQTIEAMSKQGSSVTPITTSWVRRTQNIQQRWIMAAMAIL